MSNGKFERTVYQGDNIERVYACRIQPETKELVIDGVANTPIEIIANQGIRARMNGKRRIFGVNARKVRIAFLEGQAPEGYAEGEVIALPILTPSVFQGIEVGLQGTYLGAPIEVIGKTPEYSN